MFTRVARSFPVFLLLAVVLPAPTAHGAGQNFYVTPTGNDANSCSQGLPCREIRRALELVGPGDSILVADGSYKGFDVNDRHGAAGNPITIRAQGTSAVVQKTIDRPDNRDTIFITFSSYVVLDGLRSFEANRAAVRVDFSPHVTVRNCVFGNNARWGIFTDFSDDLLIEKNETYGSVAEHGIYVSNSGDRPILRGNRSHDNRGAGIQLNADLSSGGDGIITGALLEGNVLYNNGAGGGAAINLDGVQDATVRNNLLYGNRATGIALFQGDGAMGPKGDRVYHNTVYQAPTGRWALLIWGSAGPNTVRNNILFHPNTARGGINYASDADVTSTDSDYNVLDRVTPDDAGTVYTLAQWQSQGHEIHSIAAAPAALFVNAAGGDFHLAAGSPAINRGLTLAAVTNDIEGNPRPLGPASDIGAYEAGAATPPPILSVAPTALAFGSVNLGGTKDLAVTVRNSGGGLLVGAASTVAPFNVVGNASYSLAANQTQVLTLRFSPTIPGGVGRLLSLTGAGGKSIVLSGLGVAVAPVLSVNTSSLAFGPLSLGSIRELSLIIKNAGGGTLTGAASTTAPYTVVSGASYSLAANQTQVVTVRFSPVALGVAIRTLTVTGGQGGRLSLSGTGIAPALRPKVSSSVTR